MPDVAPGDPVKPISQALSGTRRQYGRRSLIVLSWQADCTVNAQSDRQRRWTTTALHLKQEKQRSRIMADTTPQSTFRGLPLTAEQDAEVRHYIKKKMQHGMPWDTPELAAMLHHMLDPPVSEDEEPDETIDDTRAVTERATASVDESIEPIEASEERNAAASSSSRIP